MKEIIKSLMLLLSLMFISNSATASVTEPPAQASETSKQCTTCHKKNDSGIVKQWGDSKHHRAKVGCYECHAANKEDKMHSYMVREVMRSTSPLFYRHVIVQTVTLKRLKRLKSRITLKRVES